MYYCMDLFEKWVNEGLKDKINYDHNPTWIVNLLMAPKEKRFWFLINKFSLSSLKYLMYTKKVFGSLEPRSSLKQERTPSPHPPPHPNKILLHCSRLSSLSIWSGLAIFWYFFSLLGKRDQGRVMSLALKHNTTTLPRLGHLPYQTGTDYQMIKYTLQWLFIACPGLLPWPLDPKEHKEPLHLQSGSGVWILLFSTLSDPYFKSSSCHFQGIFCSVTLSTC